MARQAICISHATGAHGVVVGREVAERLGFQYVDEEVISEAAEWADLDPAFVADAERKKPFVERLLGAIGEAGPAPRLPTGDTTRALPSDADLRQMITAAVASFVQRGSVVIVAHAASFAVGGGDVLRVLVTASPKTRAERLMADRGLDSPAAERAIKDSDAGRAAYLKRFYGVDRELPTHFDVVVNTDGLTAADAAKMIVTAA
jgi:Cytidylate kinase-like family